MATLAHEGAVAFRDKYELAYRHRTVRPNATWQADQMQLDIVTLDADGKEARPWLTLAGLDALLVMVAKSRTVHHNGIRHLPARE